MPEPVITLISGVAAIVTNVWRVSKELYDIIEGIRNAPAHVRIIMVDVDGLYIVLGALQGLLPNVNARRLRADLVPIFESLQTNLDNCCSSLIEFSRKLIRYTNAAGQISMSKWMAFRWQFTEKDVKEYRDHLTAYKMTVQLAISTANFANSTQNLDNNERIGSEIEQMRAQVNEIACNQDLLGRSEAGDHGSVTTEDTDRGFALRRFLMTTESVFSGSPPGSPGMTGKREGSVSPPPITFGAQPAQNKRVQVGSKSMRDDGSVSSTPLSREIEARRAERTRRVPIRTTSTDAHQHIPPEEDFKESQPAQYPGRQYRHHIPGVHEEKEENWSYTSLLSLANEIAEEIAELDRMDGVHVDYYLDQSRQPQASLRSSKSSRGLRDPKRSAKTPNTKATLSPIQESAPAGISTYAPLLNEEQAEKGEAPRWWMKEQPITHPFLAIKNQVSSHDAEGAWKEASTKELPGYHRDIQAMMDHLTVRDAQRKARDDEFRLAALAMTAATLTPVVAAKSEVRRVQELLGKGAPLSRSDLDKEPPRQETEEKIAKKPEALKLAHHAPITDLSYDSPITPCRGDKFLDILYDNVPERHPFNNNVSETKIVQEESADTGCDVVVDSKKIGKIEERILPGADFNANSTVCSEKTHYTLPEDGSPITIATRRKKAKGDSSTSVSQTGLLIEYFEGGKEGSAEHRRPSVRVKLTPKNKKSSSNNHIQITESKGTRKPTYTKRILLSPEQSNIAPEGDGGDENTARSHRLAAEKPHHTSRSDSPIEVEIMPKIVESPSNQPDIAPTQSENNNAPGGSLHKPHFSNTSNIPPTLQVDESKKAEGKAIGEGRANKPWSEAPASLSSKSSINNPKLQETVEDAIRRLILPDLTALKREQKLEQEKKQRREERHKGNYYEKDARDKVRRKHRSRSKSEYSEQWDPRNKSPPFPTLTEYPAGPEARTLRPVETLSEYRARLSARDSILQEGTRENENYQIGNTGTLNDFFDDAPSIKQKPSYE